MTKPNKVFLIVMIILNIMVLTGQLWPAGAPPFARVVNIVFLVLSLGVFIWMGVGRKG
ncbi:MAG: hypothetical protein IPH20_06205 [Bacteroidales bacterium]|nr:hypothetical protein [Bacteroidales bacterium]